MDAMAMTRRDLRIERHYLPSSIDELSELRQRVLDLGEPEPTANGLIGWLVAKASGEVDASSAPTRSKYRRILARLDELDPAGPGRRTGGYTRLGATARMVPALAGGTALAAAGHPALAMLATPLMLDTRVMSPNVGGVAEVIELRPRGTLSGLARAS